MEQNLNDSQAYAIFDDELALFVCWFCASSPALAIIYAQRLLDDFIMNDDQTVQSKLKALHVFKQGSIDPVSGRIEYLDTPLLIKDCSDFLEIVEHG